MPAFRCKMAAANGRLMEKTLVAGSKAALREELENDGHFVLDIRSERPFHTLLRGGARHKRIKDKEFFTFNQEFSVLVKAGLPIVSALDTIIEKSRGDRGELLKILEHIRDDVKSGESLSDAFGKYPHAFSGLYLASLKAGEKSGDIPLALTRHLAYFKKVAEIKRKIVSAAIYPLILISLSAAVVFFLISFVVPAFSQTYLDAGSRLPWMTALLLAVSRGVREGIPLMGLGGAAAAAAFLYWRHTESGRMALDRLKLSLPLLGEIAWHYAVSKHSRTLATVIQSGMPLVEALRISAGTLNNAFLGQKLDRVLKKIEQGAGFSESLDLTRAFPRLAVRMIDAGESGGVLGPVLNEVADYYENDVDAKLTALTAAIEPLLMVMMGLLIGFIVLAMYLPIFQLAGTIS